VRATHPAADETVRDQRAVTVRRRCGDGLVMVVSYFMHCGVKVCAPEADAATRLAAVCRCLHLER
jgi:hypothetical protein